MAAKKTIGQKRAERQKAEATVKTAPAIGGDRIDKFIAATNRRLSPGGGHIFRGSAIMEKQFKREPSGIGTIDWVLAGGRPQGVLIELGGEYSVGKTTLAIHLAAEAQRVEWQKEPYKRKGILWVALEPFSKRWARENGLFIPFCEDEILDEETGEMRPIDPFSAASELELFRMEQAGITDPYSEICPVVVIEDQRGDYALQQVVEAVKENIFVIIVVDSLGLVRSTQFLAENGVQDAGDFPREPKILSDYTARVCLALNGRYDENGMPANDGQNLNTTFVLNLNQITAVVGGNARAAHKVVAMKGGNGIKHNHHAILFASKGKQFQVELPGGGYYTYGYEMRILCLKSKIGKPWRDGTIDVYFADYGPFRAGDFDTVKDWVDHAVLRGVIERSGAWHSFDGQRIANGRDATCSYLREDQEMLGRIIEETRARFRLLRISSFAVIIELIRKPRWLERRAEEMPPVSIDFERKAPRPMTREESLQKKLDESMHREEKLAAEVRRLRAIISGRGQIVL